MLLIQKESQQAQIRSVCFYAPMGVLLFGRNLIFVLKKLNSFKFGPFMDSLFECFLQVSLPFSVAVLFHKRSTLCAQLC